MFENEKSKMLSILSQISDPKPSTQPLFHNPQKASLWRQGNPSPRRILLTGPRKWPQILTATIRKMSINSPTTSSKNAKRKPPSSRILTQNLVKSLRNPQNCLLFPWKDPNRLSHLTGRSFWRNSTNLKVKMMITSKNKNKIKNFHLS